jgi:hypothetical protein
MLQLFGDLTRQHCQRSGVAGLIMLWYRTAGDLLLSLGRAYLADRRASMFKLLMTATVLYVCVLVGTAGYSALRFGEFYAPPAFSRLSTTGPVDEDALLAAYDRALGGDFGRYKAFVSGVGLALALSLGVSAALFGLWQRSWWHGVAAFGGGAILTMAGLELLPPIWFPFDHYAAGALWVVEGVPIAAVVWLAATVAGRLNARRQLAAI